MQELARAVCKVSFEEFEKNASEFYRTLSQKYPSAKIFAITPIWRSDYATDTDFGTDVVLTVTLPSEDVDDFCARVTELTAGSVEPLLMEKTFMAGPREEAR